jgi:hypothetical protein
MVFFLPKGAKAMQMTEREFERFVVEFDMLLEQWLNSLPDPFYRAADLLLNHLYCPVENVEFYLQVPIEYRQHEFYQKAIALSAVQKTRNNFSLTQHEWKHNLALRLNDDDYRLVTGEDK